MDCLKHMWFFLIYCTHGYCLKIITLLFTNSEPLLFTLFTQKSTQNVTLFMQKSTQNVKVYCKVFLHIESLEYTQAKNYVKHREKMESVLICMWLANLCWWLFVLKKSTQNHNSVATLSMSNWESNIWKDIQIACFMLVTDCS